MQENYFRHINIFFRPFYTSTTGIPLSKPRFVIDKGKLKLIENPVRDVLDYRKLLQGDNDFLNYLGKEDYYFKSLAYSGRIDMFAAVRLIKALARLYLPDEEPLFKNGLFNTNAEAFQVTDRIIDAFYKQVLDDGSIPVIVVFPDVGTFNLYSKENRKRYAGLINGWKEKKYNYIDLTEYFLSESGPPKLWAIFAEQGHYNAFGNDYVAKFLYSYLRNINVQ